MGLLFLVVVAAAGFGAFANMADDFSDEPTALKRWGPPLLLGIGAAIGTALLIALFAALQGSLGHVEIDEDR